MKCFNALLSKIVSSSQVLNSLFNFSRELVRILDLGSFINFHSIYWVLRWNCERGEINNLLCLGLEICTSQWQSLYWYLCMFVQNICLACYFRFLLFHQDSTNKQFLTVLISLSVVTKLSHDWILQILNILRFIWNKTTVSPDVDSTAVWLPLNSGWERPALTGRGDPARLQH